MICQPQGSPVIQKMHPMCAYLSLSTAPECTRVGRGFRAAFSILIMTGRPSSMRLCCFNGSSGVRLCKCRLMQHRCCLDFRSVDEQWTFKQNAVGTTPTFKHDQICATAAMPPSAGCTVLICTGVLALDAAAQTVDAWTPTRLSGLLDQIRLSNG